MRNVAVPFRGGHLSLSLTEAEELAKNLAERLERVRNVGSGLIPPHVSNGLMTRSDFYEFFIQLYPEPAVLRNHAGKLFGRIVRSAQWNRVPVRVVCLTCTEEIKGDLPRGLSRHDGDNLAVDVASLKEHADELINGGYRMVAGKLVEDLELLLRYL